MKKRIRHSITGMILCFLLCVSLILTAAVPVQAAEGDTPADESFTVPRIVVTTEGGNGTALQKSDGYVGAHITITGLDGSVLDSDAQIKVRGNTTALSWIEKKSFTFKFGTKKDVLGMGKGKKWVVVSNVFDPTLLRNFLAFETADELGLAYTSRHQFVELWLDGSFRGSYVLFEPVQEGKDRVDIDIESNGGKKDFLVEYETETAMQDPDDTYFKAGGHRFIASDPDEPTEEQLAYIQDVLTDIINTIKSGDEAQIAQKIDVSSFVKYYLMNEYFKTYDFSVTSVFFYYKDGLLYAGPPWDYDLSMGNSNPNLTSKRCRDANSSQGVFANTNLFVYLADKTWFKELVRSEYIAHREYFSGLHTDGGVLDTIYATYSDTISRNYSEAGWKASKSWINIQRPADKTYDGNYQFLKNWLAERNTWFEAYFEVDREEEEQMILGDADGDGEVNVLDATAIQRYLVQLETQAFVESAADADEDGDVTILDATAIQCWLVNLPANENIGEPMK